MPVHDELGIRMKTYYEQIPKTKLMRRTPVIIRIDGKAFHTFTKGFRRPFDGLLMDAMRRTTKYLCENIQGCVLGYTQSDEISLVLVDYQRFETDAWFDYEVQKICSISASMATMAFNRFFTENVEMNQCHPAYEATDADRIAAEQIMERMPYYLASIRKGAMFDARCFNIPKEEVTNMIYWRQLDASRNSIQMVGQAYFSHRELEGKSCSNIQDMLMEQHNINWNNFPTYQKRGSCVVKRTREINLSLGQGVQYRTEWVIDNDIPIFKGEGRQYVEQLINFEEEV